MCGCVAFRALTHSVASSGAASGGKLPQLLLGIGSAWLSRRRTTRQAGFREGCYSRSGARRGERTGDLAKVDRLLLRPMEAAEAIGVCRSKMYELLASGEIPSIRIGGRVRASVRVPVDALRAWIERRLAADAPLHTLEQRDTGSGEDL